MPSKKPATRRKTTGSRRPSAKPGRAAQSLTDFCRSLPATTEDIKWEDHRMFSIGGKIYAGFDLDDEDSFGFKCDDDDFDRLTAAEGIIPAPYAARFGWVKVLERRALSDAEARAFLRKSHGLVAAGLSARKRRELGLGT